MVEQPQTNQEKPDTVSSAADIRAMREKREKGEVLEFPSGFKARLCRPSLAKMLKEGQIPNELMSTALKVERGASTYSPADVQKTIEVTEVLIQHAFVEPKLVKENPAENEISFDELSDDDRAFAFSYVQAGEAGLEPFRLKQGGA